MLTLTVNTSLERDESSELAYINTLPPELLDEIFKKCGSAIALGNPNPFPFNLAQVCKLWRSIIYSSPGYWSCFRIDNDKRPVAVREQLLLYLSKADMLSFSINIPYISPAIKECMKIIKSDVRRWKNVSIPMHILPSSTSRVEVLDLSKLEKLRIGGGRLPLGLHAPNLTHLCLHSMLSDSSHLISSTLLDHLTHLQFNHYSMNSEDLILLVKRLNGIEDIQLSWVNILGSPIKDHSSEGRIRMERLRSLTLAMPYNNNSFVLDTISAPKLLSLSLFAINRDTFDDGASAEGFIRESNCNLLDVTILKYSLSSFLSITDKLASIQSLQLGCTSSQCKGIRRLVESLPRLKSFSLWCDSGYDNELFDGLLPFLRSSPRLSFAELKFGGVVDWEREEGTRLGRLQELKIEDRMAEKDKFFMDYIFYDNLKAQSWWA